MNNYYKHMLKKGEAYQDFVREVFKKHHGWYITFYTTKREQYNKGESVDGIEVKLDDRYKDTGNLYIEVAEKTRPSNRPYVESGIFRKDNTWLYIIGDYSTIFMFLKKDLVKLYKSRKYREIKTETSKGFLLDTSAHKNALKIIDLV